VTERRPADVRLTDIERRHRPGFDPRHLGARRQCVRCRTPWPCDAVYVLAVLDAVLRDD